MPGLHLTIDGADCTSVLLWDPDSLARFLEDMAERIDMKIAVPPYVHRIIPDDPQDSGLSGVVIIYESHISCHTWPHKNFVYMDVFSCKPFSIARATAFATEKFGIGKIKVHAHERGQHFPETVRGAVA